MRTDSCNKHIRIVNQLKTPSEMDNGTINLFLGASKSIVWSSHTYLGHFNPSVLLLALVHCSVGVAGAVVVHQLSVTLRYSSLKMEL